MICCLCVDTDWAHPVVAGHLFDRLAASGVPFTLFATEDQAPPAGDRYELAWHPNFARGGAEEELELLRGRFPGCRGVRPHRLAWGGCGRDALRASGIAWTSSASDTEDHVPAEIGGLPEVTISWGDNWWFLDRLEPDWAAMEGDGPGLYVLNIHPIHVFLNTAAPEQYERAKAVYHDPAGLKPLRNSADKGVSDVLDDILECYGRRPGSFMTISRALARGSWRGGRWEAGR